MKILTTLILSLAFVSNVSANNWGFEPIEEDWGFSELSVNAFGMGLLTQQQDCPGGVCLLPQRQVTTTRTIVPKLIRPTRQVTRTYIVSPPTIALSYASNGGSVISYRCCGGSQPNYLVNYVPQCQQCVSAVNVSSCQSCYVQPARVELDELTRHLMGPPHYIPAQRLAGMSHAQKEALHNQEHGFGSRMFGRMVNRPRLFPSLFRR